VFLAYALIVTEPGCCAAVAAALDDLPGTVSVEALGGPYDLVVKIQVLSEESLLDFVRRRVSEIDGIRSATTLVASPSP
jgi:DNA-binding Lrp family transcriptional regulator